MIASSIKVRTNIEDGIATVRALIQHPMETGSRKDPYGQTVPAHYIKQVVCKHNGIPVLTTYWGAGISRNPYLSFKFAGAKAGDILTIQWEDNQGNRDSVQTEIK